MVIIIILVVIAIIVLRFMSNHSFIKHKFKRNNVIVFGYKGTGKDLIFQKVISLRKKEQYYAYPQSYGWKGIRLHLDELNLNPNTFDNFINDTVTKLDYQDRFTKADFYLSDGGVVLPSQADAQLKKWYPSYPIAYALSRQLWRSNFHLNTQGLSRVWKMIREQADTYFKALLSINIGIGIFTKVRFFEEYQSAEQNLLPFKTPLGSGKQQRALKKQFTATNGMIKDFWIFTWKFEIKYDSWYYKKVVFKDTP